MSLSATLFGTDSAIFKATNILGLGIPGWLNKQFGAKEQKPTTQRIGELAQQTAKEGEPRPIVWGRVRPISGNIMHSSAPRIIRREVKGQSSGGKGGKKKQPKQYEERVFRTYAIRICEGPITAIIRVWRNNRLVYDARGNAWGAQNNGVFLNRARFYLGGWTQMPDPTLESKWGAGNVPGYRGTCYMVVPDEDLTETGGAVPQYIFEVERAEGTYVTSLLYPVESVESLAAAPAVAETFLKDVVITLPALVDAMAAEPAVVEITQSDQSPRPVEYLSTVPAVIEISQRGPYSASPEYLQCQPAATLLQFSITYDRQSPEGILGAPSIEEVSLI